MEFLEYIELIFTDYTLRTITIGTALLGAISGLLGSFAVLKKQSLLGDAISHAALPGIALAFIITQSKSTPVLLIGALASGVIGALWVRGIIRRTHLKTDTALGIILSVFFGFGILLLTYIQKLPQANQAGLDKFLFGQAATLIASDVYILLAVLLLSIAVIVLFWKELKVLVFDEAYAQTLGFDTQKLDILITFFIVVGIVVGLQTVGVILMSAMLLAPAAAARQWTNRLHIMLLLAALFGASSGIFGSAISAYQPQLSTGPIIILVASVFVILSFTFAPNRGLLMKNLKHWRNRRDFNAQKALYLVYNISEALTDKQANHHIDLLSKLSGLSKKQLYILQHKGWLQITNHQWKMTAKGRAEAQSIFEHSNPIS